MKFLIKIVLLIIWIATLYSQQYWVRIPSPTTKWLYSASFTDTLNGWIAGDSGAILHTSNAGNNWSIQNSGINYYISYITFLNLRLGWGIANDFMSHGTTILKTTNGGVNWSFSRFSDTATIMETIFWKDSLSGFLGGQYGKLFRTSNSGINWVPCFVDSNEYSDRTIYKFKFVTPQIGYASGGDFDGGGIIWNTTNSGLNWHITYASPEPIFDMVFINSQTIIGSGGDYDQGMEIIKSYNAGNSWNYRFLQMFGYGSSIAARTNYEIWVSAAYGANMERSLDTGNNFIAIHVPDTSGIQAIVFIDSLHGWAVGSNSSIYKFNRNVIGINKLSDKLPSAFKLEQNYPNPFNPSTIINYTLPLIKGEGMPAGQAEGMNVKLVVYDLLGRQINTLVNKEQAAGNYQVKFDGTNYPSGVYFYKLSVSNKASGKEDEFSQSKKMILIK